MGKLEWFGGRAKRVLEGGDPSRSPVWLPRRLGKFWETREGMRLLSLSPAFIRTQLPRPRQTWAGREQVGLPKALGLSHPIPALKETAPTSFFPARVLPEVPKVTAASGRLRGHTMGRNLLLTSGEGAFFNVSPLWKGPGRKKVEVSNSKASVWKNGGGKARHWGDNLMSVT